MSDPTTRTTAAGQCPCACHAAWVRYVCHRCACPDQAKPMNGWPDDYVLAGLND